MIEPKCILKEGEKMLEKSEIDYGIFPPPTEAQEGLNILIKYFLDENWYTVNPISQEQVNTEAIEQILAKHPKRINHLFHKILRKL